MRFLTWLQVGSPEAVPCPDERASAGCGRTTEKKGAKQPTLRSARTPRANDSGKLVGIAHVSALATHQARSTVSQRSALSAKPAAARPWVRYPECASRAPGSGPGHRTSLN